MSLTKMDVKKVYTLVICSQCKHQIKGEYWYSDKLKLNYCPKHTQNDKDLIKMEAVILRKETEKGMNKNPEDESKYQSNFTKDELKKMNYMNPEQIQEFIEKKRKEKLNNQGELWN